MESNEDLSLQIPDYVVFVGMIVFTLAIGIRYAIVGKGSKSRETYFVADRKMHFIPVAFSLMVTFESSIMMLGLPAEIYLFGTSVILVCFGSAVTHLLTAFIAVPLFKPLKITSVYEYLQQRFQSRNVRLCGVLLFLLYYLFYLGIVLYAQAVAIEAVMGVNMWISILVMDACAVFYTSLGGIKSVVWTDVFQAVIMFIGILAVIIKGTEETGGTYKVWEHARTGDRLQLFNFDPDPTTRHTVWTMFFPKMLNTFNYCFSQSTVQRISASKSEKDAKRMVIMTTVLYVFIYLVVVYEGLVVYAFLRERKIEPLSCGLITNPNQILPYTVLLLFKKFPGMAGVFMAALYSSTLSTVSSGLSSMSILVMEDLLQPVMKNMSDAKATIYAKISVTFLGAACLLFCVAATYVEGPFNQIATSLLAAVIGPTIGLFMVACFFPSTTSQGTLIGILVGTAFSITLSMGGNFSDNVRKPERLPLGNETCGDDVFNTTSHFIGLISNSTSIVHNDNNQGESYNKFFSLSYCLFAPLGAIITIVVTLISSYVLGRNRPGDVNPKYLVEVTDAFLIFLPARLRRFLKSCGPQFQHGWKESPQAPDEVESLSVTTTFQENPLVSDGVTT